jgi:hypothetical protein
MQARTIEGIVKNGQIVPSEDIKLPEMTTVYIVIPRIKKKRNSRIMSPKLVDKSKLADFEREIIKLKYDEI